MIRSACILAVLISGIGLYGQIPGKDAGELYDKMRSLGENDNLTEAIQLGVIIHKMYPAHNDASVYLALLYGRNGEYEQAETLVNEILEANTVDVEAHRALATLLFWQNKWQELLIASTTALRLDSTDIDLLYQKALAHYKTGENDTSLELLSEILNLDGSHGKAIQLRNTIFREQSAPELFLRYFYDHFTMPYVRNWHLVSAGLQYPLPFGTLIPHVARGVFVGPESSLINTVDYQVNLDAYITLSDKNYMLAGYGIGTGTYLPLHRGIVHLWQALEGGWGLSAGARYFYFDDHYLFYAVGVEKYLGDFWFDLNNYIFNKAYGLSVSTYLTARKYFENRYQYISAVIGYGTSPDEPYTTLLELQRLKSLSFRLEYMQQLGGKFRYSVGAGYQYEEFRDNEFRNRIMLQAALYYKLIRR